MENVIEKLSDTTSKEYATMNLYSADEPGEI